MEPRLLAGRYELRERLGDSTYLATDTELGREVVVRSGEVVGATLSHGSIGRVFDQGEFEGERYAVLEYLPGGTLAERGELGETDAAELADALAYAHAQGVPHGALDAEAIRFDAEGRAKLTGFTGAGDPAADLAAFDALRSDYAATAVVPPAQEEATLIQRPASPPQRRRGLVLAVLAALGLAAAGVAAAILASSDGSPEEDPFSVRTDPISSVATTEEEPAPPPSTTEETTTATTETTQPATTEPPPPPPTTLPPPTVTLPLPTTPTEPPTLPTEPPVTEAPIPTGTT